MENVIYMQILSIKLKDKKTLDLILQIEDEQKNYLVPFFVNEIHGFDLPEELRRILRVHPSVKVSHRLTKALADFVDNKPVELPLTLNDVASDKREAA